MKVKKVFGAALMLSLSMGILACVPENNSNAYDENKEIPLEIISEDCNKHMGNGADIYILHDKETGVEYIYVYNYISGKGSSCAIQPRLDKNGRPIVSR